MIYFADDHFAFNENGIKFSKGEENEQFLLFFHNVSGADNKKPGLVWENP